MQHKAWEGKGFDMIGEALVIILLLIANGVLAMSEIAIVSSRKVRLQERADRGDAKARAALELANAPNEFLSTVQIGITLVGILAGAFGGATIAETLAGMLVRIPWLAPYSEAIGVGVVVLCITYLSLIIGELVPKRLALNDPELIASNIAGPMRGLSAVTRPVVRLLTASTNLVLRVLGVRPSSEPPVTEEELAVLIEQGTRAGVFQEAEQDMMTGVLRLADRQVGVIMTPRTEITWLDVNDPPDELGRKIAASGHSRFPVSQDSLDNMVGIVQAKDLSTRLLAGQPVDLRAIAQSPLYVPETKPVLQVIELFRKTRMHIALVIDEYGGLLGLVTINDILEDIVGDLPSVGEPDQPSAVRREDGSWLLEGLMPVDEIQELLRLELPEESRGGYRTLGGLMMAHLGRIPSVSDHFEWAGFRFEVVDMDGHRVDKVLVAPCRSETAQQADPE